MKLSKEVKEFFSPEAFKEFFRDDHQQSSFATILLQIAGVIISMFVIFYYLHQLNWLMKGCYPPVIKKRSFVRQAIQLSVDDDHLPVLPANIIFAAQNG